MNRATKRLLAKQEKQAERERARQAPLSRGGGAAGGGDNGRGRGGWRGRGGDGAGGGGDEERGRRKRERGEREGRIKRFRRFLKEVRQELKKVAWPSRGEVMTYTVVVLVSVTTVTLLVFGLDFLFGKAIFTFFSTS
jgi:preprotein translocase subunit SecE